MPENRPERLKGEREEKRSGGPPQVTRMYIAQMLQPVLRKASKKDTITQTHVCCRTVASFTTRTNGGAKKKKQQYHYINYTSSRCDTAETSVNRQQKQRKKSLGEGELEKRPAHIMHTHIKTCSCSVNVNSVIWALFSQGQLLL